MQALYHLAHDDEAQAQGQSGASLGVLGRRRNPDRGIRGRLGNLVQVRGAARHGPLHGCSSPNEHGYDLMAHATMSMADGVMRIVNVCHETAWHC